MSWNEYFTVQILEHLAQQNILWSIFLILLLKLGLDNFILSPTKTILFTKNRARHSIWYVFSEVPFLNKCKEE